MEKTKEEQMLQAMLDNIENDNIWNDSGSFKLDNCPFSEVFPAMQAYADQQTTSQSSVIKEQAERIEKLEAALSEIKDGLLVKHKKNNHWYNLAYNALIK